MANIANRVGSAPRALYKIVIIRFSSITVNLGPTFLSGALAANADAHIHEPSCPLVQVYINFLHY